MPLREFAFRVCFGEGKYAKGIYKVEAFTESEAIDLALTEICKKLYSVLPELDIEVTVKLIEEEIYFRNKLVYKKGE